LRVTDTNGHSDESSIALNVVGGVAFVRASSDEPPYLDEAIVYGMVPPLYGTEPLRAAAAALDGIADLGVTIVWLPPLFGTPPGDYGYAVTDFERVRRDYGTADDLHAFVTAAHRRKLRVLLDLVANHTSNQHPYFQQAEQLGFRSHYHEFFEWDEHGRAMHYFDWEHLPNLQYQDPEVGRFMTEISERWIRAFRVDGYRADAAWGVARRNPAFWPQWSAELRRVDPDLFFLAEASAREPYWFGHGFDAAYDWTEEPGQWAWKDVFASKEGVARRLYDALARSADTVRPHRTLRFLNNNDTGERFIARHGEDMTRVATAALLTLPGIPCLFSFDEVGGEFDPYAVRGPIAPPPRPALRAFHEKLIWLRRATPALRGRGFALLFVDDDREVLAYVRRGERPEEIALVVLHFGASPAPLHLTLPESFSTRTVRDALTGQSIAVRQKGLDFTISGWQAMILVMPPAEKSPRSAFERGSRNNRSLASSPRASPSR
jgi:glycosidase